MAIEYLSADPAVFEVEAAEAVSAQDVKDYYEANKDTEFVVEPPAPPEPPAPEKEEGAGPDKPAAEADTKEAAGAFQGRRGRG